jgi:hypothetical protein
MGGMNAKSNNPMKFPLIPGNCDVRSLALLPVVFILSLAASICIEMLLWRTELLLAIFVPFVIYMLASLRFVPWRTPMRKAFSLGILSGMFVPLILYAFGYWL